MGSIIILDLKVVLIELQVVLRRYCFSPYNVRAFGDRTGSNVEQRRFETFTTTSLGCRTNQYEIEAIKSQLRELGLRECSEGEHADIGIINTCSVTDGADSSSRHAIRSMKKAHPNAQIVVTGCMVNGEVRSLFPEVVFVENKEKEKLVGLLFPDTTLPEFAITCFDNHTRAFIKVQDGCNSFCSYCVIPFMRGRSRSRTIDDVVREVKTLVKNGYREVVLTGINIGDFDGGDGSKRLSHLVQAVDEVDGLSCLRISSIDPNEVDGSLIEVLLNGKTTCPSMHIVLQSGSNSILKRMNRKYTKQMFFDTLNTIHERRPDCTFTTDVIVGFPGETEQDFLETVEVVRHVQFAKVHIFPYSERPHTRSSSFSDKVGPEEIGRRKAFLQQIAEEASFQLREKYVGTKSRILTEQSGDKNMTFGHTPHFLEVSIPHCSLEPNQLIQVELIENSREGLIGRVVE